MRSYQPLNNAIFSKAGEPYTPVTIPHTWNAEDGQSGNDYWRGEGTYRFNLPNPTPGKRQYIEIRGANHIATIWCNNKELGTHKGGFSTFRYELTQDMKESNNSLQIAVSNAPSNIYPQHADFTFFGGLYREVYFVEVEDAHFDLMKHGSQAVFISPYSGGTTRIDMFPVNADGCQILLELADNEGNTVFSQTVPALPHTYLETIVENPHLWHGIEDPYLYQATATLLREEDVLDQVTVTYGYRSYHFDPNNGFYLNGKSVPLHGVCRHQDREDKGWAISKEDHLEDIEMIRDIGANTIRLAHYQHDQYFYDLCDQMGFAVWAEIPYISHHLPGKEAYDVTMSMMTELIAQCYNHPSIIVWGIANEITIFNVCEEEFHNLHDLNALVKKLDPSRPTTMAHLARLPITSTHMQVTDIMSYNYYHGWYTGTVEDNGPALDAFHTMHPDKVIGVSEYGVENILSWHSAMPFNHDYTEEYANFYHHELLKCFATRPYLWATHVWNMFDFAAAIRNEGGVKGRNNKGLVTMDRKTKKDAYYIYKAFWSKEPMVYIASRRFQDRAPEERNITVYTNCDAVTLWVGDKEYATIEAVDHAVVFTNVPMTDGKNIITAKAGSISDTITLNAVAEHNTAYDLPDLAAALQMGNWFAEKDEEETDYGEQGYNCYIPMKELFANPRCLEIMKGFIMSRTAMDLSSRFKLVSALAQWGTNENYCFKLFPNMKVPRTTMTEEDFEELNKMLRTVKRP